LWVILKIMPSIPPVPDLAYVVVHTEDLLEGEERQQEGEERQQEDEEDHLVEVDPKHLQEGEVKHRVVGVVFLIWLNRVLKENHYLKLIFEMFL